MGHIRNYRISFFFDLSPGDLFSLDPLMQRHHFLLLPLLLLLVLAMSLLSSFLHFSNTYQHSSPYTTTSITPITPSLHILFSSDLNHNWGSYQMRANQMADEMNQMGPNYMASHIYAAAATTHHHHHLHGRKQTSHHACISIKSVRRHHTAV